jgi:hypothetical protein
LITSSASSGTVELLGKKDTRGFEDLVRPLQLRVFLAELLQLVAFGGGETVVPLTVVGLGLADPAVVGWRSVTRRGQTAVALMVTGMLPRVALE